MKLVTLRALESAMLLTLACGLSACGSRTSNDSSEVKIVGGYVAPARPFMASLMGATDTPWLYSFCGGTFIRPNVVLTAAHCVEDTEPEDFRVAGGTASIYHLDEDHTVGVEAVEIHPNYRSVYRGSDLALVFLKESEMGCLGNRVIPAPLNAEATPESIGTGVVAGWGQLTEDEEAGSDTLLEVELPIIPQSTCRSAGLHYRLAVTDQQFCAGDLTEGGIDSCYGDSGGPLFLERGNRTEVAGIVSWGRGCGRADKPGVYTRVSSFTSWINATIAEHSR